MDKREDPSVVPWRATANQGLWYKKRLGTKSWKQDESIHVMLLDMILRHLQIVRAAGIRERTRRN